MVGGKRSMHSVKANVKEFSKNALSATNRAIATTISTYSPFISASLMNASTAAFDVSRFAKENNPLMRNKNKDPYIRRAINRATDAFQTSLNELRQGHLSFEETRNEISEYINENSESEWDSMAASAGGEAGGAGGGSQKQFSVSDYVKGVAASSRSNVRALQVTTNKITESQYKSLNLATSKIISSNMANMQAITRQFSVTNSRIENVNANLVNLVQFNNTSVSEYFQTSVEHMGRMESYLEEMVAYARLDNEKRTNHYNGTGSRFRSRREEEESKDFLSYGFDPGKFAKSVIDNLMETAFGPTVLTGIASGIKGIFGKVPGILADYAAGSLARFIQQINPLQLAVEKFMPSLKGFASVDDLVRKTITSFFSQLGSGTYGGPFSEIARLFGIKGSTSNIDRGDYNHDEAPWTGEDSRALKQVIPDYLATIEMKMANMVDQSVINTNAMIDAIRGVQVAVIATFDRRVRSRGIPEINGVQKSAVNSRRLYDYESGDFTNENKIIDRLRESLHRSASMHYDESKQLIKELLAYADESKLQNTSNRKALSDALTAIFMNFNAVDGETAINRSEEADLIKALQNIGIDIGSGRAKDLYGQFKNTTNAQRLTVNRDVGHEFQYMRNLGLGAGTNDISTDIVNHNADVISSAKNVFTLESILRTLDDELDNFDAFKRTDAYKNMDRKTKQAYEQMSKERDRAYARQGVMAAILDPSALQTNPFNVVAATVVDSTTAVAASLSNVVSGVSTFSEELRNITDVIRETITNIKSFMIGGRPDLGGINGEGHDSGATNVSKDSVVKVHKGEIILDPTLSDRVRNGIADFINGDMSEKKFDKKIGKGLTESQVEEIKFIKQAMQSAGKLKIKKLDDVTDQIWDAAKYIDKAPTPEARLELLLRQIARNQEVGLLADNIGAIGESDRDEADMRSESRDRKLQTLRHGVGKINKDGLFEGGVLSDFANSVKGTYDKVVNSLVGRAYNTYEDDGQGGKKLVHHEKNDKSFLNRYKNWLVKRAESAADALGIKGKHKENIAKTFNFLGENGHKLVLGGLAGMVANVVLPVAIGPVLGVGAALIGSSKTLNERLFGTIDEQTGMRADDGLISTKVTNFVKENMFSLISGGILGMKIMKSGAVSKFLGASANKFVNGLVSIIPGGGGLIGSAMQGAVGMAFGPVGGALLGMGVAAMVQSEHVKSFLFGDKDDETGKRTGGVIGSIRSAFTNLGDALKEKIFGRDVEYIDENGRKVRRKDGSGLLNRLESSIYAHLLRPITTSAKYIGKYFALWFKDDVLNATKRIIYPIAIGINNIAESIRGGITDVLHEHAKRIKSAFEPVTKAITGISSKLAKATLSGVENIIKLSLKSVSAPLNIVAALFGKTKLTKISNGAKAYIRDGHEAVNLAFLGESLRLFFDNLRGGANQFLHITSTNKKDKNSLQYKIEKFLDLNEKLFGKLKSINDVGKAIFESPLFTPLRSVVNVLTHPFSVIVKNIAAGALDGIKALITAPFKLISLPFSGIKWVGNKLVGKDTRVGKAFRIFKEQIDVMRHGGAVDENASDITKEFAAAYNKFNNSITTRAKNIGLLKPGQDGLLNAVNEHTRLKNEKKLLEKQHKRDKALDRYISKLNLQMSPAEFDALPVAKRNEIIANLIRKSGNKEIAKWDAEKIRALVTGGRSKVEEFDNRHKKQETATDNIVNLPDTIESNTTRIVDKIQEFMDAITGNSKSNSSSSTSTTTATGNSTGNNNAIPKKHQDCVKLAKLLIARMNNDPSFTAKYPVLLLLVGKPRDVYEQWLIHTKTRNRQLFDAIKHDVESHMLTTSFSQLSTSLTNIRGSSNDKNVLNKNSDDAVDAALQRIGVDPSSLDESTLKSLRSVAFAFVSATPGSSDYNKTRLNLFTKLQNISGIQANKKKTASTISKVANSIATKGHKILSTLDADVYRDRIHYFNDTYDPTTHKKSTKHGKYIYDDKTGRYIVAAKDDKGQFMGDHNLTKMGYIRHVLRNWRDGTTDAVNPDDSLNVNGMNWRQKIIARGMLGKGWEEKKSRGELDRDKEQELVTKLKMLASGEGKAKLVTSFVGKVLRGLTGTLVFLTGMGLFMTKLLPIIKDPVKKLLFGDPNDPNDGIFGFVNGLWTNKIKPGIKNAFDTGLKWAFGDPDNPEDIGAIGNAVSWVIDNIPEALKKGFGIVVDLGTTIFEGLKQGINYYFDELERTKQEKDNNTVGAKDLSYYFQASEKKEETNFKLDNGEIINIVDKNGNINFDNLMKVRATNGFTSSTTSEKTSDDYKIKVAFAQFGIPIEVHGLTGNINDAKVRRAGKYFVLADNIGRANILGLSDDQINSLKSLKAKGGKKVDGYLFILIDIIGAPLMSGIAGAVFNKLSDTSVGYGQWAIYPAIWNETAELWKVSPTRCGFCTQGVLFTGKEYDSDISTDIDSSDGLWSYYNDMRQEKYSNWDKTATTQWETAQEEAAKESAGSGRGSIGYGHFTQNDPRWGKLGYGKMRSGGMSTMANGGCGPTAMANAINNVYGRNVTNPLSVANYASKNGYSVDGGTSAGLFNKGAKAFGVNSSAISKNGSSIANQLRHGKNVIVAGRGGSAYTSAGHIMSVRGIDRSGNAIVDDPMRRKSRHIPMNKLTRGMTHAWSIGRGPDDVYYGTSPDGSNYAFLNDYLTALGNNPTYFDTTSATSKTIGGTINTGSANDSSIIWGYDENYKAACFVKSIASAVYNLYAKKKGLNRDASVNLISSLGNSYAQPHTLQRSGSYGAGTGGYVNDYSKLANNVYSALNSVGGAVSTNGISLTENRGLDPTTQKSIILSNLSAGKPVIIHIDTAGSLSNAYRKSVFGKIDGDARTEHAVLLNNLITAGNSKYVLIGDPGSAQSSRNGATTSGTQIRLVNFDQLTDPLANSKLNHLLTINDGGTVPMLEVTAPNPERAMGTASATTKSSDITIGTDAVIDNTKSKITSFTDFLSGLVTKAAKIGSALLTALFTGRSFKEIWADMNASESAYTSTYTYNSTNPVYNPTTYVANASDEYKAAYDMVAKYDNSPGSRGFINWGNVKAGRKYINYNSELYEDFTLSNGKWYNTNPYKDETGRIYGGKLTSQFAADLLGMAIFYIKEYKPQAIDGNFKRYCILVANLLSKTAMVIKVYKQYTSGKMLFRDTDGIFMFVALCFEKMLLGDRDAEKCNKQFMKAIAAYQKAGGDFGDKTEGSIGFGIGKPKMSKENKAICESAIRDMELAAKNSASVVHKYMKDNLLMMTYDDAKKIISEQAQTAQINGTTAASGYTTAADAADLSAWSIDKSFYPSWATTPVSTGADTWEIATTANLPLSDMLLYTASRLIPSVEGGRPVLANMSDADKKLVYASIYHDVNAPSFGLHGFHGNPSGATTGGYPGTEIMYRLANCPDLSDEDRAKAKAYADALFYNTFNTSTQSSEWEAWARSDRVFPHLVKAENAMATALTNLYFRTNEGSNGHNPLWFYENGYVADPRTVMALASIRPKAPYAKYISTFSSQAGYPSTELANAIKHIQGTTGDKNRMKKIYAELTDPNGRGSLAGGVDIGPLPASVISMIPSGAPTQYESSMVGAGPGNRAVNIHDAMMNTPTTDIYTSDDVYMGDANHPMNVKMDTTPTTSRLDVIIELLNELLKGDSSLPPATSKSTQSIAGYGEGTSKTSNTPIIIANHPAKADKANTNLKSDRLRGLYDKISKRALTYTH